MQTLLRASTVTQPAVTVLRCLCPWLHPELADLPQSIQGLYHWSPPAAVQQALAKVCMHRNNYIMHCSEECKQRSHLLSCVYTTSEPSHSECLHMREPSHSECLHMREPCHSECLHICCFRLSSPHQCNLYMYTTDNALNVLSYMYNVMQ